MWESFFAFHFPSNKVKVINCDSLRIWYNYVCITIYICGINYNLLGNCWKLILMLSIDAKDFYFEKKIYIYNVEFVYSIVGGIRGKKILYEFNLNITIS